MRLGAQTVVTPDRLIRNGVVEIDDGRIVTVETSTRPQAPGVLVPGFVDLQVNGGGDVDVADAAPADLGRLGGRLLADGVTAWCPTLVSMPLDRYATALDRITAHRETNPAAHVLGAHLEGPFLGGRPGAHDRRAVVPVDAGFVDALPDIVRLVTIAPEAEGALDAIRALTARGVLVSIGHTDADFETATQAISAGARLATHLFNAMSPLHHREPGAVGAALADDRVAVSVIPDLVHVHPAVLKLVFRAKGPQRVVVVTDAVGLDAGRLADAHVRFDGTAPRLPDGTLAGSALRMPTAVGNLVDSVGVPLLDAVRAASTTPADRVGVGDRGRIEPRCRADLALLDDNYSARTVWVAGREVAGR